MFPILHLYACLFLHCTAWTGPSFILMPPSCQSIIFLNGSKTTVTISCEGKVTLGEGVSADEAAKAFWDAVERLGTERKKPCHTND